MRDVLKTWELTDCRPLAVPGVPTKVELPVEEPDAEPDPEDVHRAQKLAGSLIWLSTRTRPDTTFAQSRISSMMPKAPKTSLIEGIRVLRYLKGTKDVGLQFRRCSNHQEVITYTNANFSVKRSQTVL